MRGKKAKKKKLSWEGGKGVVMKLGYMLGIRMGVYVNYI